MRVYSAKGVSPAEIAIHPIFRVDPSLCKDEVRVIVGSHSAYIPNFKHYWRDFLDACKTRDTEERIERVYDGVNLRVEFSEDSKVKVEIESSEITLDADEFIRLLDSVDVTR